MGRPSPALTATAARRGWRLGPTALGLLLLLACHGRDVPAAEGQAPVPNGPPSLEVALRIEADAERITAHLAFTNPSGQPFALYEGNTCDGGSLDSDLFQIVDGQHRLAYRGRLVKRPAPAPSDFKAVPAGGRLEVDVRLEEAYAFPPSPGEYVATYQAYNPSVGVQPLTRLVSNAAPFSWRP